MKEPTAASLRDLVRFDRRAAADDGYGNTVGAWAELVTEPAQLLPTRGRDEIIGGRLQGVAAYDLWVRSNAVTRTLTPDDRAVDARDPNRTFNIRFVADMTGRGQWLFLQLSLGTADG